MAARVFLASEALAAGAVSRSALRTRHRRVLPGVYAPRELALTVHDRATAAWLWSQREGVLTGAAASALHGAKWIPDDIPIELNWPDRKSPAGLIVRTDTVLADEVAQRRGVSVSSVPRTAFDLARRGSIGLAVERLDALAAATGFKVDDVLTLAHRHPHVRGLRRVPRLLELHDSGAQSPKETWLRLMVLADGYARPVTQFPVLGADGYPKYYLDLAWPEAMVALEYDGEHHRTDVLQYRWDVRRAEYLAARGWRRVVVIAGDRRPDILRRLENAFNR